MTFQRGEGIVGVSPWRQFWGWVGCEGLWKEGREEGMRNDIHVSDLSR